MFQNEIRKDLKEQNPNITNAELLVLISRKWAELSEEDKAVGFLSRARVASRGGVGY